jgi:glycosyltransferase involved in cell wall biosynthesis
MRNKKELSRARYSPKISVVMSVYNGDGYIRPAIESILNQTFKDFEFIIIDDGSTDSTNDIISCYDDRRIILIEQENRGLSPSLNTGIRIASGEYIARMDADDISHIERFEKQIQFMDSNPEYVMVGTNAIVMDREGTVIHPLVHPTKDSEIRRMLLRGNAFVHGTVLFRRDVSMKAGLYDEDFFQLSEDLLFWRKVSEFGLLANLSECLYSYRLVPSAIGILSAWLGNKKKSMIVQYGKTGKMSDEDKRLLRNLRNRISDEYKISQYYFNVGNRYLLFTGNTKTARTYLFKSIFTYPFMWRSWYKMLLAFVPQQVRRRILKKRTFETFV